jgi:hypothetical protein
MKTHFVTKFTEPGDAGRFYRNGNFVDFCRGPHVPSTGRVKAFKVLSWPARTGWAMRRIRSCSASMERRFFRRRIWTPTSRGWKKRPSATIACWASSSTSSASRSWPARAHLLASQGRHDPQDHGRLDARGMPAPRLLAGLYAARDAPRAVEDQRPRGLYARTCTRRWSWTTPSTG